HLGRRAAADVQEVRRPYPTELLTRIRDNVQGGHDQAGTVADDADRAVELDVVEVALLGPLLQRIHRGRVLQRLVVGVAERGVVVEGDLRVQQQYPAVGDLGQRVHLDQQRVLGDERLPQLDRDRGDLVGDVGGEAGRGNDLPRGGRVHTPVGVDRNLRDLLRRLVRDLLDLHAAGDAGDAQGRAVSAGEQVGGVLLV